MPQPSHLSNPDRPMQQFDGWEQDILSRLPADLEQHARRLKAFQRSRKLRCAADLLRGVLAYVLAPASLRSLSCWATVQQIGDLSERAWGKHLRQSRDWLTWILQQLLTGPNLQAALPTRTLPQSCASDSSRGRILLVDASRLRQPGGCGDDWRLHLAYELRTACFDQVRLTDQHGAENLTAWHLRPGDVVVADSGYGSRKQVLAVFKQGAHAVVRIRPATFPLLDLDDQPLDVVGWLKEVGPGTHERTVRFTCNKQLVTVRLIAQSIPPEKIEQAQAKRREASRRHGRQIQEDTLFLAGWMLLVTTLSEQLWSSLHIVRLYRARWQIELIFKRLKSLLKLNQLRSKHPETVEAMLTALLIAWVLQEQNAQEIRTVLADLPAVLLGSADQSELRLRQEDGSEQELLADPQEKQEGALSSWVLTDVLLIALRSAVLGPISLERLRQCLPHLRRFLRGSQRKRPHQESQIRALIAGLAPDERGQLPLFRLFSA